MAPPDTRNRAFRHARAFISPARRRVSWLLAGWLIILPLAGTAAGSVPESAAPDLAPATGTRGPPFPRPTVGGVLRKALSFEITSSATESALFVLFYGTATSGLGTIFAASLLSASGVYVAHEYAWDAYTQGTVPADDPALIAAKTLSYRALSTARSFLVSALLGAPDLASSAGFALTVAVVDSLIYVGTEMLFAWSGEAADTAPLPAPEPAS